MNRRWFALILMISLIPGCSGNTIEAAPSEALYETKPRSTVGFSSFYKIPETDGAIQAVVLNTRDAVGFRFIGEDILIFSGHGNTTLTLLDSRTFAAKVETTLPLHVSAEDPEVTVSSAAVTYVDNAARELVFLNTRLEALKRIPLPEEYRQGVLSSDQQFLYYCTTDAVRVLDLISETDRPIREMCFPQQEVTALHCNRQVIQCRITGDDGTADTLFLSAEDGRRLCEAEDGISLWTEGNLYFSIHMDGDYRELLSGSPDYGPSVLVPESEPVSLTPMLQQRMVLLHSQLSDGGIRLDAYHLESGKRIAQTVLPKGYEILDAQPDPKENSLWFLCADMDSDDMLLCCWDLSRSDPKDSGNYLQTRWSQEEPDLEGLSQCQEFAAELSQNYGIQILLWTDATQFHISGHRTVPEYRVPLIRQTLQELDAALSAYPEGFLQELAVCTDSNRLTLCLVQHIYPEESSNASLPGLLYWDNQGEIQLIAASGSGLPRQVHRLLCELIDNRVLGLSDAYDGWCLTSPRPISHQERVRILEAALQEDQGRFFSSGFMQSNLRQLCLGIREAFPSAAAADQLPWEQHLAAIQ